MKFEQYKPLFQILQIMEKHYDGGCLKCPPMVRLTAGGCHKSTASTVVCQNLKNLNSWPKNVQNSVNLPKFSENILI
jgi:hypothetical protein